MSSRRFMPALLLLFVGSGCAALIYEIVWFQLLQLVIGSSAISLGVLLGTFMGGMCLGSLLLPRLVGADQHPLRVYAYLELGIGALGLLILFGHAGALGSAYTSLGTTGVVGLLLRGVAAAICLLPPTLLMGATLPAIARWVKSTPEGHVLARILLRRQHRRRRARLPARRLLPAARHDMAIATYVAVALNVVVAGDRAGAGRPRPVYEPDRPRGSEAARPETKGPEGPSSAGAWAIYIAIGALGIDRARLRSAVDAHAVAALRRHDLHVLADPRRLPVRSRHRQQHRLGDRRPRRHVPGSRSAGARCCSAPRWRGRPTCSPSRCRTGRSIRRSIDQPGIWFTFQLDFVRALWAMLPARDPVGRELPAGARVGRCRVARIRRGWSAASTRPTRSARSPAPSAAACCSRSGSALSARSSSMIIVSAISALLVLDAALVESDSKKRRMQVAGTLLLAAAMAGAVLLARTGQRRARRSSSPTAATPPPASAKRTSSTWARDGTRRSRCRALSNGVLNYHNAGKVQASSEPQDMRLQRMLGHLTTLIPKDPKNALVIGCGAGVTAGAVSIDPAVTEADDRRDRAARPERRLQVLLRA